METTLSWTNQLRYSGQHEVRPRSEADAKTGRLTLFPSARLIDEYIRDIPAGDSRDLKSMKQELAARHGANVVCPVTTGVQLRIVAEAAHESFASGASMEEITPVWRVMDETTPTLKKLSFDPAFILDQRTSEGI